MKPSKHEIPEEARQLILSGNKIEGIKMIRQHTGLGLKESKDLADAFETVARKIGFGPGAAGGAGSAQPEAHPGLAPGEQPREKMNPKVWLGVAAAAIGLIAVALLRDRL